MDLTPALMKIFIVRDLHELHSKYTDLHYFPASYQPRQKVYTLQDIPIVQTDPRPLLPLPSPFLCPCHAFLAALIFASEFMQDKGYMNCAWVKLAGLSPHEIGHCKCEFGEWAWLAPLGRQAALPVALCSGGSEPK